MLHSRAATQKESPSHFNFDCSDITGNESSRSGRATEALFLHLGAGWWWGVMRALAELWLYLGVRLVIRKPWKFIQTKQIAQVVPGQTKTSRLPGSPGKNARAEITQGRPRTLAPLLSVTATG